MKDFFLRPTYYDDEPHEGDLRIDVEEMTVSSDAPFFFLAFMIGVSSNVHLLFLKGAKQVDLILRVELLGLAPLFVEVWTWKR